jgi:hypothetical protein
MIKCKLKATLDTWKLTEIKATNLGLAEVGSQA